MSFPRDVRDHFFASGKPHEDASKQTFCINVAIKRKILKICHKTHDDSFGPRQVLFFHFASHVRKKIWNGKVHKQNEIITQRVLKQFNYVAQISRALLAQRRVKEL